MLLFCNLYFPSVESISDCRNTIALIFIQRNLYYHILERGLTFTKIICGLACGTLKNWLSIDAIPIFRPFTHPPVYQFCLKSAQICSNWVLFAIICSKYTQFLTLGSFISYKNTLIVISNFAQEPLKRQTHMHPMLYENQPLSPDHTMVSKMNWLCSISWIQTGKKGFENRKWIKYYLDAKVCSEVMYEFLA